jgi:long-chain acyl-CoA synthetase
VDEEGFISIVDRVGDFIKSWGNRVSSAEVEACALQIPELVTAAAVGVPDPAAGEAVTLFVTGRPGMPVIAERVLDAMRRALPTFMVPQSVMVIDEMPLNSNGKIVKAKLREMAMARQPAAGVGR